MKKPFKTVDQLVKEALANKPGFTSDEPTVFGNPKTLNKTNQEIEDEECKSTSKPTKQGSGDHK
jgi:hypothetical protein